MLKFLVIIFFLKSVFDFSTNNTITRKIAKEFFKMSITNDNDAKLVVENNPGEFVFGLMFVAAKISINFISLLVNFYLLSHDSTYITLIYILYLLVIAIKSSSKIKIKNAEKTTQKDIDDCDKVRMKMVLRNLIDVAYWGYVIYFIF